MKKTPFVRSYEVKDKDNESDKDKLRVAKLDGGKGTAKYGYIKYKTKYNALKNKSK